MKLNHLTKITLFSFLTVGAQLNAMTAAPDTRKVADLTIAQLQEVIRTTVSSMFAFVDPYFVLSQIDEVKDAEKKLKSDLELKEKQIMDIQYKIKEKEDELRMKASALSPDARERYNAEILSLRAQGQTKYEGLQAFVQQAQQQLEMGFLKKIQEAAEEIATENNMILVYGAGIVYGHKGLNISEKVVSRLNKKYTDEKRKSTKPATPAQTTEPKKEAPKANGAAK